jgi:hypothetical protein
MKNSINYPVRKVDKSLRRTPLHFGTVIQFKGIKYIFQRYLGIRVMLLTMDAQKYEIFNRVEFNKEAKWLYQLTVKFYKGFDYAFTDDGLIINHHSGKAVNFCDATKLILIERARQSANFYLRTQYEMRERGYDSYRLTICACMIDHHQKHHNDYLLGF